MLLYIITGLFILGIFSFGKVGLVGAIAETVLMIAYAMLLLKLQYDRVKGKTNVMSEKPINNILFLVPTMMIGVVYFLPKLKWLNILVLAVMGLFHIYCLINAKNDKDFKWECVRAIIFTTFLIIVNIVFKGLYLGNC